MARKTKAQLEAEALEQQQQTESTVPTLKVLKLSEDAVVPARKTTGAVGLDLTCIASTMLYPRRQEAYKIPLGIALEIPEGYHAKVFLRSSIGLRRGLRLANGTGIIDSDYRGELTLIVENIGLFPETIVKGERIAQLIVERNIEFDVVEVKELSVTERNSEGFGSTGK